MHYFHSFIIIGLTKAHFIILTNQNLKVPWNHWKFEHSYLLGTETSTSVFELRKNKIVGPRTSKLQLLVVHRCFWLSILGINQKKSLDSNGCPSICLVVSSDFFGRLGRTDNQNFECWSTSLTLWSSQLTINKNVSKKNFFLVGLAKKFLK